MILCAGCSSKTPEGTLDIRGITYAAPPFETEQEIFTEISTRTGANYIALIPYAFHDDKNLYFDTGGQWRGETVEGVEECTMSAQAENLKIMIKPHIWRRGGNFTGDLVFEKEQDWRQLEAEYTSYIIKFARLADQYNVEIFSLGNELKAFVANRPDYWPELIDTVRTVYKGNITYSANWDNYHNVGFWEQLDYVGINAYFPLCEMKTPSLDCLSKGWEDVIEEVESLSSKIGKPVIFTEFGYRNIDYTATKPWESYSEANKNDLAQANALTSVIMEMKNSPAIIGGFLWKWELPFRDEYRQRNDFTIQDKMAEEEVKKWYLRL